MLQRTQQGTETSFGVSEGLTDRSISERREGLSQQGICGKGTEVGLAHGQGVRQDACWRSETTVAGVKTAGQKAGEEVWGRSPGQAPLAVHGEDSASLSEGGSHPRILNRRETWFDLDFRRIMLAALLRINFRGQRNRMLWYYNNISEIWFWLGLAWYM